MHSGRFTEDQRVMGTAVHCMANQLPMFPKPAKLCSNLLKQACHHNHPTCQSTGEAGFEGGPAPHGEISDKQREVDLYPSRGQPGIPKIVPPVFATTPDASRAMSVHHTSFVFVSPSPGL